MDISVKDYQEHKLIILEGEFNLYNVKELRDAIFDVTDGNNLSVIIDLGGVTFMDSPAIGALYLGQRKMEALNGKFYLANVTQGLDDIIKLTGLTFKRIDVTPD